MLDPGQTLVAVSVLLSKSNCTSSTSEATCTTNAYPVHGISIFESPSAWVSGFNVAQNYAIASVTNSTNFVKTYQIKLVVTSWSGLSSTTFGVAWAAHGGP